MTKEDKQLAEATELHREVVRLGNAGKHRDAVALARKALEIRTSILGEEHPDTAASLNDLGVLYRSLSDYATAEPLFIQALKIREKVLKPDHPDLAVTLNELGLLYKSVGDYAKAEPFYRPRKGDRSIYAVL